MSEAAGSTSDDESVAPPPHPSVGAVPAPGDRLALLRWHLDRYDRLRASTASRAAVVLSAGALLSAANAVIISQLLGTKVGALPGWALAVCTVVTLVSSSLVVLSVIRASSVLVTGHDSRTMFARGGNLPLGVPFNGTDTVRNVRSFDEFATLIDTQTDAQVLRAARVELWLGIQQHRHRYLHLRRAVRLLRYASVALLVALATVMVVNLVYRPG